jgi:hypothetical protein
MPLAGTAHSPFLFWDGRKDSQWAETLRHYNRAPTAPTGHTELKALRLNAEEVGQIEAFLRSLSGGTGLTPVSH